MILCFRIIGYLIRVWGKKNEYVNLFLLLCLIKVSYIYVMGE